jgi:LAO/AO transport system kinase
VTGVPRADGVPAPDSPFDVAECAAQVVAGSRPWTARAITLVESTLAQHHEPAQRLLAELTPHAGGAHRVGITGVPGAGKSTLIDALGSRLTAAGHRVAVLAVDPSSSRSGGSILGDRTRMTALAADPRAFVRPSPTSGTLGGVAAATREAIVVVEAAGYDVVLVETVGVGQSEIAVAGMVDTFVLLTLAGAGDQLQGIKRGVLELADMIAVNKADGEGAAAAARAARELAGALRLIGLGAATAGTGTAGAGSAGRPAVLACSARDGTGLAELWDRIARHYEDQRRTGAFHRRRAEQLVGWTWALVTDRAVAAVRGHPEVLRIAPDLTAKVLAGELTPVQAAELLWRASGGPPAGRPGSPPGGPPGGADSGT